MMEPASTTSMTTPSAEVHKSQIYQMKLPKVGQIQLAKSRKGGIYARQQKQFFDHSAGAHRVFWSKWEGCPQLQEIPHLARKVNGKFADLGV